MNNFIRQLFCFMLLVVSVIFLMSPTALADQQGPVLECEGLAPVELTYRAKDDVYVGRITMPAANKDFIFTVSEGGKVITSQRVRFHENASGTKITFIYRPNDKTLTNDYVFAFAGPDGKVAASSLFFNSRDEQYKKPYGAVPQGTDITLVLEAKAGDLEKANVVMNRQVITGNQESIEYLDKTVYPMTRSGVSSDGAREYWSATVAFNNLGVYTYYFEAIDGKDVVIYANNSTPIPIPANKIVGVGGVGEGLRLATEGISEEEIPRYRQTVYDPNFKTPDWAKDIIYYYIFPDRFKNGNKANDPKPGVRKFYDRRDIVFHKNWLDKPWTVNDKIPGFEWGNDFFGGDIAGIVSKLDYLRDLGVNTIYSTPLFQSPSNHKYDTADFKKIDEAFGTMDEFKSFIEKAHKAGMRFIMDASLNHSGADSIYMDRYGKYPGLGAFEKEKIRKNSKYYDWYLFDESAANPDQKYAQWAVPSLAAFNKNSEKYRDFAFRGKDSIINYWMDTGIDGWRMDVAPWVPDDFWREWRKAVKAKNPEALAVCETWWDSSKFYAGDMFDSGMNYIFRQAVLDYADGKDARAAVNLLEMMRENYPSEAFFTTMNLLSSHDAARALFRFGYKDEKTPELLIKEAKSKLLLATFFQMTYPGAPAIYYGDEVGVTGGEDPGCRATYPWKEDGGQPDETLLAGFKKLIKLRNDNAVLRRGSVSPIYVDSNVIVMLRKYGGISALVAMNNGSEDRDVNISVAGLDLPSSMSDALSGEDVTVNGDCLTIRIPACYGRVLISK